MQALAHDGLLQSGLLDSDRIPFTGGGNRTHVAVPKNLLTTDTLYHSTTEVLIEFLTTETLRHSGTEVFIEFDKYFGRRVVQPYRSVFSFALSVAQLLDREHCRR